MCCERSWGKSRVVEYAPVLIFLLVAAAFPVVTLVFAYIVRPHTENKVKVCTVYANRMMFALTTFHEIQTAREMAGLVRYQLRQMGFEVNDDRGA